MGGKSVDGDIGGGLLNVTIFSSETDSSAVGVLSVGSKSESSKQIFHHIDCNKKV
jgi:hypothetical protein